jgi:hypothetical protein
METCKLPGFSRDLIATLYRHFPQHFARRRGSLGPRTVYLTLMIMSVLGYRSYRRALRELREVMGDELGWFMCEPSKSAFSLARRKLSSQECVTAFEQIRRTLGKARTIPRETFHGLRLHSIDGTRLSLPVSPALGEAFGYPENQYFEPAACPQAGLVVLWDTSANQPVAWELGPYRLGEREAALRLFRHLGPGDLLLADRGFPSLGIFSALRERGADFIIRMNTTAVAKTDELRDFLAGSAHDQVIEFAPLRKGERRFDGVEPLRIRLVRDPCRPDRVLATSLVDAKRISATEVLTIYLSRWNIETAFRETKQWHGLEDFHAMFPDGIHQEVAAIMTFVYLTGELEVEMRLKVRERIAQGMEPPESAERLPYRFNRLLLADVTKSLLFLAITNPERIQQSWEASLRTIWSDRDRIRPGRSYPRRAKSPRSVSRKAPNVRKPKP